MGSFITDKLTLVGLCDSGFEATTMTLSSTDLSECPHQNVIDGYVQQSLLRNTLAISRDDIPQIIITLKLMGSAVAQWEGRPLPTGSQYGWISRSVSAPAGLYRLRQKSSLI